MLSKRLFLYCLHLRLSLFFSLSLACVRVCALSQPPCNQNREKRHRETGRKSELINKPNEREKKTNADLDDDVAFFTFSSTVTSTTKKHRRRRSTPLLAAPFYAAGSAVRFALELIPALLALVAAGGAEAKEKASAAAQASSSSSSPPPPTSTSSPSSSSSAAALSAPSSSPPPPAYALRRPPLPPPPRNAFGDPLALLVPPPVARYLRFALPGGSRPALRLARATQTGDFRFRIATGLRPDEGWKRVTAEQTWNASASTPGYCWAATVKLAPGLWVRGWDALCGE